MAIVKTIMSGTAVVDIDDSCCSGLTQAEIDRRWAEVDRVIWMINRNHQRRAAGEGTIDGHEPQTPAE